MKPISELVNDRDACERIGKYLLGADASLTSATVRRGRVEMEFGQFEWVSIRLDGRMNSHDGISVPNPFAFVALMNELGYGPEKSESKVAKVLAVEGGGDWADASVDYLVNISGRSGEELIDEYKASGGFSGNGRRFFRQWVIESGYCREPNDDEVEVVSESM